MRDWLKLLGLLATILTGCGGGAELPSHPATAHVPASVTITLPAFTAKDASLHADPGCTRALTVELSEAGGALNGALLADTVVGNCERLVRPNRRFYALARAGDDCGSEIYKGQLADGKGSSTLTVVDHRHRVCDDYRPYLFELTERTGTERSFLAP